jgi:pyrroloquinoline-quinone synthase
MEAKEFLQSVKSQLDQHALFSDRLIQHFENMEVFDREKAQTFAELYYPHILRTRLYQASTLGIVQDEVIQFVLAEIVHDEYGLGDVTRSHMQLYRNFMRGVGCNVMPAEQYEIIPELQDYIDVMEQLTRNGDWLSAVAAVGIASEWPIPKYYTCLLNGFRKIPSIEDKDIELFTSHVTLDIEHSRMIEEAVLPHLVTTSQQQRFMQGIEINMDARQKLHEALYERVFV